MARSCTADLDSSSRLPLRTTLRTCDVRKATVPLAAETEDSRTPEAFTHSKSRPTSFTELLPPAAWQRRRLPAAYFEVARSSGSSMGGIFVSVWLFKCLPNHRNSHCKLRRSSSHQAGGERTESYFDRGAVALGIQDKS